MKVVEVNRNQGIVETGGILKAVDLSLIPQVLPGDYVIVHAGFAIERMNEAEARNTLELFDEMIRRVEGEKR
jgi:hydrogenase expression/formation protein HypC